MSLPPQGNEIGDRDKDCETVEIRKRRLWEEDGRGRFITLLNSRFTHHVSSRGSLSSVLPNEHRPATRLVPLALAQLRAWKDEARTILISSLSPPLTLLAHESCTHPSFLSQPALGLAIHVALRETAHNMPTSERRWEPCLVHRFPLWLSVPKDICNCFTTFWIWVLNLSGKQHI